MSGGRDRLKMNYKIGDTIKKSSDLIINTGNWIIIAINNENIEIQSFSFPFIKTIVSKKDLDIGYKHVQKPV